MSKPSAKKREAASSQNRIELSEISASQTISSTQVEERARRKVIGSLSLVSKVPTFFKFVKQFGIKRTLRITKSKLGASRRLKRALCPSKADLESQSRRVFEYSPVISIIVPLFNTDTTHFSEALKSVLSQTYSNWELILVNASDNVHQDIEASCKQYSESDSRIHYIRLDKNLGISGNTNAGLEVSTGEYLTLLDHDDLLHQSALYEIVEEINKTNADLIYSDELNFFDFKHKDYFPHFKPDYSPDTLRSYNYICHLLVYSRKLRNLCGDMRAECSGSQDYDLALRLTERAERVSHIPKLLYFWRQHSSSFSHSLQQKEICIEASKKALSDHIKRIGLTGRVLDADVLTCYRIKYEIVGQPQITIIIPNCDHMNDLKICIDSILNKTVYQNYEIIIVENNSVDPSTFEYYRQLNDPRVSVLYYQGKFNYSAINNLAAQHSCGEYLLFLNNDTEVISPEWLTEMLMFAQRKDVGAVGAKLYYPDDTIQHAGVILKIGGTAGHAHRGFKRSDPGYSSRLKLVQNVSAVTGACLLVSRNKFFDVGGFTESFEVALNDVDLCLKLRKQGYLNVFTPYAELYHFESKSRGYENNLGKKRRFKRETKRFHEKWGDVLDAGDPYYNPNLTLDFENFSLA